MKFKKIERADIGRIILWIILLGAGLVFLIYNNTHEGIWLDETSSVGYASHPINELLRLVQYDSHPPLYYIMLSAHVAIFGKSLFALRTFSAFGIFALAALGAGPVRKIAGEKCGMVFTFLVFITPASLIFGQEIRMYSWAGFFVTGCLLYGYLALTEANIKNWSLYGIFLIGSGLTHYYAMMSVVLIHLCMGAAVLYCKNTGKTKKFIVVSFVAAVFCAPWGIHFITHVSGSVGIQWIPKLTFDTITTVFAYPYGSNKFAVPEPPMAFMTFLSLFVLAVWGIYDGFRQKVQNVKVVLIAIAVYLTVILFAVAYSFFVHPALTPRYMLPMLGLYLFAIAYALSRLQKLVAVLLCAAILLACSIPIAEIEKNRYNGPTAEAASYINENIGADDAFLHPDINTMGVFAYYFPNHRHYIYYKSLKENSRDEMFAPNTDVVWGADIDGYLKGKKKVWIVNNLDSKNRVMPEEWAKEGKIKLLGEPANFEVPYAWLKISVTEAEAVKQ